MKTLERWRGYITTTDTAKTFFIIKHRQGREWELSMPTVRARKLFGRKFLRPGAIVDMWLVKPRKKKPQAWGQPYTRVWTQEDIDAAEKRAEMLYRTVRWE